MAAALGAAFTTAVRMVDRVHRRAADVRPAAQPALAAGLADHDRSCDRHCRSRRSWPGRRTGCGEFRRWAAMICAQSASRAISVALVPALRHKRAAAARLQSRCCESPCPAESSSAAGSCRPSAARPAPLITMSPAFKPVRGQDVPLLAVDVVQQRNAGRAVRIVLDRIDLGRHAVLVAAEVDQPVLPLVAAAAMPRRDLALVVAAARLRAWDAAATFPASHLASARQSR